MGQLFVRFVLRTLSMWPARGLHEENQGDNQHLLVWRTKACRAGAEPAGLAGRGSCWAVLGHWCEASDSERGKSGEGSWWPGLSRP